MITGHKTCWCLIKIILSTSNIRNTVYMENGEENMHVDIGASRVKRGISLLEESIGVVLMVLTLLWAWQAFLFSSVSVPPFAFEISSLWVLHSTHFFPLWNLLSSPSSWCEVHQALEWINKKIKLIYRSHLLLSQITVKCTFFFFLLFFFSSTCTSLFP